MAKKRPVIKMKTAKQPADTGSETGQNLANLMGSIIKESTTGKRYAEEGTEGQWDAPEPSWKDEEDSDYRVHPAGRYVGSTRSKGSRQELDAGHQHEGHTQR